MVSFRLIELRLRSWAVLAYSGPRTCFVLGSSSFILFMVTAIGINSNFLQRSSGNLLALDLATGCTIGWYIASLLLARAYLKEGERRKP